MTIDFIHIKSPDIKLKSFTNFILYKLLKLFDFTYFILDKFLLSFIFIFFFFYLHSYPAHF